MIQLRCVIITHSRDGATIDEIIEDFLELTGEHLMDYFFSRRTLMIYLATIDGVWYSTEGSQGIVLWFCSTPKTQHITEMIKSQHSACFGSNGYRRYMPRAVLYKNDNIENNSKPATAAGTVPTNEETNVRFISDLSQPRRSFGYQKRPRMVRPRPYDRPGSTNYRPSWRHSRPDELEFCKYGPSYHHHQLLGDDFFLAIAKWELGFSFDPGHDIEMSGLCISGLTLSEAAARVQVAPYMADRVLINVGTVDLLHGRVMIDLIHDFELMMTRCRERNVEPIVTTLAPLANSGGRTEMAERLLKFNEYIRRTCPRYIDLWKHFVHADGTMRIECYQPGPRSVTGSIRPHVLWNRLGRHYLLSVLGSEIADKLTGNQPIQG